MNCRQFTSHIVELARGQMSETGTRDDSSSNGSAALRHAESCEGCAARLERERRLSSALRTVANGMSGCSAPASLEATLLASFQARIETANVTTSNAATSPATTTHAAPQTNEPPARPVVALFESVARRRAEKRASLWPRRLSFAALAASLILVAFVAYAALHSRSNGANSIREPASASHQSPVNANAVATAPMNASTNATEMQGPREVEMPLVGRGENMRASAGATQRRTSQPRMITVAQVIDGGSAVIEAGEEQSAANEQNRASEPESVTEFMPLVVDAAAATPLESGQLVRVQLLRSAAASLGLPLNAARENERIKADVLLGDDGVARAIRFVR